jgi:hypothetical protein
MPTVGRRGRGRGARRAGAPRAPCVVWLVGGARGAGTRRLGPAGGSSAAAGRGCRRHERSIYLLGTRPHSTHTKLESDTAHRRSAERPAMAATPAPRCAPGTLARAPAARAAAAISAAGSCSPQPAERGHRKSPPCPWKMCQESPSCGQGAHGAVRRAKCAAGEAPRGRQRRLEHPLQGTCRPYGGRARESGVAWRRGWELCAGCAREPHGAVECVFEQWRRRAFRCASRRQGKAAYARRIRFDARSIPKHGRHHAAIASARKSPLMEAGASLPQGARGARRMRRNDGWGKGYPAVWCAGMSAPSVKSGTKAALHGSLARNHMLKVTHPTR